MVTSLNRDEDLLYPESDGKPMAESTEQYRWIIMIKENLEANAAGSCAPDVGTGPECRTGSHPWGCRSPLSRRSHPSARL
jgi:hypothetical protein